MKGDINMGCLAYLIVFSLLGLVVYGFTINVGTGIVLLLIVIGIFALIFKIINNIERGYEEKLNVTKEKIEKEFQSQNFTPEQVSFSCNNVSLIAFDENSKQVCIVTTKGKDLSENV